MGVEPTVQPLTGEQLSYRSANVEDGACLDVVTEGFWDHRQKAYFDVKVFNPLAPTYSSTSLPQCYRWVELEKRRMYEERIWEIEHGSFTPLVFSCSGGMGPLATIVYRRLASLISKKSSQTYSMTLYWLRCKLSFSFLHLAITCLRGSRSSYHHFMFSDSAIDLACGESHLELDDNLSE